MYLCILSERYYNLTDMDTNYQVMWTLIIFDMAIVMEINNLSYRRLTIG